MTSATVNAPLSTFAPERRSLLRHELLPLYKRSLLTWLRVPAAVIPPLVMPVFFLIVNTAALQDSISRAPGMANVNYISFFLPVSLAMTVASAGASSGLALVQDIDAGFFDKLLLSPISRTSILISRLMVDGTRAAAQTALVLIVGILIGADMSTGFFGALLLIVMAFAFGLAYAGIGLTIALRTGSTEATQASFMLFFPLVMLSPAFVPMEALNPWLQTVARFNPVSLIVEGMRTMTAFGWQWDVIGKGFAAIAGIAVLTQISAFKSLRARASM